MKPHLVTFGRMTSYLLIALWTVGLALPAAAAPRKPDAFDDIIRRLGNGNHLISTQARLELSTLATNLDLPRLHGVLRNHPSAGVRWRVAAEIGHLDSRASIEPLSLALSSDKSADVRLASAQALGDIGAPEATGCLVKALAHDEHHNVRRVAARSLTRIQGRQALPALQEALKRESQAPIQLTLRWLINSCSRPANQPAQVKPGAVTAGTYEDTDYLRYILKNYQQTRPHSLLVSVRGSDGIAQPYMSMCLRDAERFNLVVIAPRFDWPNFPHFGALNISLDTVRSDLRLLEIISDIAKRANIRKDRFLLFGHSQGGQFVNRFVLAHPDRIARAAACGSGCYTHPIPNEMFPGGLSPNPFARDLGRPNFGALVQTPLAIVIGTKDLPRRLEQADQFMKEVRAYAARNNLPCKVEFFSVPDGPHVGARNFPTAAKFLFQGLPSSPSTETPETKDMPDTAEPVDTDTETQ